MRGVIFDLDGTLADTSGDLIAAANACFRQLGLGDVLDPVRDAGTALKGGRAMLRLGFARTGSHGEDEVDRQYRPLLQHYEGAIDTHTVLYPGAMDAVRDLRGAGYKVAICTNKPEGLARQLLTSLGVLEDFGAVLGADSLPVRKPDPEHLDETARRAGADPRRVVLVGDTDTDRNTARNAGVPSILVTFGPGGGDMAALEPEGLISSYAELPAEVSRLIG
ncbi:HAD-IIIA family hydrolase [Yoonia sp. R2331]|uniref:HAD-IIIA family hydrolase n=1 Tax=Yoonia sp. R2331 TaxID=3237238 RepID=UPI0034E4222B